jgi:hypothetical protein
MRAATKAAAAMARRPRGVAREGSVGGASQFEGTALSGNEETVLARIGAVQNGKPI